MMATKRKRKTRRKTKPVDKFCLGCYTLEPHYPQQKKCDICGGELVVPA